MFKIVGYYKESIENLDETNDFKEALRLVADYKVRFGQMYRFEIVDEQGGVCVG